jgi:hypothetical protein
MGKTVPILWVFLPVFLASALPSWSAAHTHDPLLTADAEITGQPARSNDFHEDLEKRLRSLLRGLEKLEKEAREKMNKEILPYLMEEMERIKKWLEEFQLEKEKEDQPERIRT